MVQHAFDLIESSLNSDGPAAALQQLGEQLREQKDWHNLFDARMLQKKLELGLPLTRPASLQDVPESLRSDVEETYRAAAREAGEGFLSQGDLQSAWMYLHVIREPAKIAAAFEDLPDEIEDYATLESLLQIALFQGVHPVKGLKMMLANQGTCSTITALDQTLPQLTPAQRSDCAALMVRHLYDELRSHVRHHVEQKIPAVPPDESLERLMAGRDWLFENGNYHIDISHLGSVVRIARSLEEGSPELELARQLALYGSRLDSQLRFTGEPPFLDFHPAHLQFFNVLLDRNRDTGLQYFRDQLAQEPDEQDRPILAYVLVDLLVRSGRMEEAVEVAAEYLSNLNEEVSLSFEELCADAGRLDILKRVRREQGNLVGFTSALLRSSDLPTPS